MRFSGSLQIGIAVLAMAALTSCTAGTQLTSSWAEPTAAGKTYQKYVVVGATDRAPTRHRYEDAFVTALHQRGLTAVASYSVAGDGRLDKDAAAAKLQEIGADAVIVTRLVDQESYQEYYPPTYSTVAAPSAYYGGWYGYYSLGYSYQTSPGYTVENKVFRIETNVYDVKNEKLLWSGITETTVAAGESASGEIEPTIVLLVMDMEKHGILPKPTKK
jgi:hypothetical protein